MSGPDELEMSAAVKLAACVPLTIAKEALKMRAAVQTRLEDETHPSHVCGSFFNLDVFNKFSKNSREDDLHQGDCI